jgi:hypothetical protein
MPLLREVDDTVTALNEEIFDNADKELTKFIENYPPLDFHSDGDSIIIRFFNVEIWSSIDQERPMDEDGCFCNSLIVDIRKRIQERLALFFSIKIGV